MKAAPNHDLDHLAARVHGRRGRMAEGERLDALCRSRNVGEFAAQVFPAIKLEQAAEFQRQSVQHLIRELSGLRAGMTGAERRLLDWLLVRFQVENFKVLLRARTAGIPLVQCQPHLVELPKELALEAAALMAADSLNVFVQQMPRGRLRQSLEEAPVAGRESSPQFFREARLDRAYFQELLARAGALTGEGKEAVTALARQEADHFHLMLVARGRFHYGLAPEQLLPLHQGGTRLPLARFTAMLGDATLRLAVGRAVGRALDELPPEHGAVETPAELGAAQVEALAWKRYARLANRVFRQDPTGFGAIVGYVGLRRLETANLITLSEGLRLGRSADALRARLIPHADMEVAHV